MACAPCIARQRKLVEKMCKSPESWLCRLAKERLARMESERTKR